MNREGFLLRALGALGVSIACAWSSRALAQQESASAAMGDKHDPPPSQEIVVHDEPRSPEWTQARPFGTTRVWLLDRGAQAVEAWYTLSSRHDGAPGDTRHLWQLEYMVSPIRGFELDVYFNYAHDQTQGAHIEGAQIEGRFAPWSYGSVFGNPALYVEWHPRNRDANRGELRLLLGGELFTPRLRVAINPFFEQNLDARASDVPFAPDREMGASGAIGYEAVDGALMLGGEVKAAADQQGTDAYHASLELGPSVWARFGGHFHATLVSLFGVTSRSDAFNPTLIFGYRP